MSGTGMGGRSLVPEGVHMSKQSSGLSVALLSFVYFVFALSLSGCLEDPSSFEDRQQGDLSANINPPPDGEANPTTIEGQGFVEGYWGAINPLATDEQPRLFQADDGRCRQW
jgi:hypothetical protein